MRITGGELCGRSIKVPSGDRVRPTQDRVRSALYSMLAEQIPGARVLDLFAGSGAVGLDAVSRGAAEAVWVESDRRHVAVLRENVRALNVAGLVVCDDALRWLRRAAMRPFDLVFADPPYDWAQQHGFVEIADLLRTRDMLPVGGIFVTELSSEQSAELLLGWETLRDRVYGHTRLAVYRLLQ